MCRSRLHNNLFQIQEYIQVYLLLCNLSPISQTKNVCLVYGFNLLLYYFMPMQLTTQHYLINYYGGAELKMP